MAKRSQAILELKKANLQQNIEKEIAKLLDDHLKMMIEIYFYNKKLGSQKSIPHLEVCQKWLNHHFEPLAFLFSEFFEKFMTAEKRNKKSSTIEILFKILKDHFISTNQMCSDERALVFVDERATSKWLAELLAADPYLSTFNPR